MKKLILSVSLKGVQAAIVLVLQYIIASNYTIEDVGQINLLLTVFSSGSIILNFGYAKQIIYSTHRSTNSEEIRLGNVVSQQLVLLLLIFLLLLSFGFKHNLLNYSLAIIPGSILYTLFELKRNKGYSVSAILIWNLIVILVLVIVSLLTINVKYFVLYIFATSTAIILFELKKNHRIELNFDVLSWDWIGRKSYVLSESLEQARRLFPFLIPYYLLGDYELGIFSLSLRLGFALSIFILALNLYIVPQIKKIQQGEAIENLKYFYIRNVKRLAILCTPILCLFLFFSEDILLRFGQDYADNGVLIFRIVLLGIYLDVIVGPIGAIHNIYGNVNTVVYSNAVALVSLFSLALFDNVNLLLLATIYALSIALANLYLLYRFYTNEVYST